jgi:hypothetical protein
MIQKDTFHNELWLVGETCGHLSRVTRGLFAVREELAKPAAGTVDLRSEVSRNCRGPQLTRHELLI